VWWQTVDFRGVVEGCFWGLYFVDGVMRVSVDFDLFRDTLGILVFV
jgi:hypothetical protein